MCATYTTTVPEMHNGATTTSTHLQETRCLHGENRAGADGGESMPSDHNTKSGRYNACD